MHNLFNFNSILNVDLVKTISKTSADCCQCSIYFNASVLGAAEFFTSPLQGHATVLRHVKNVACMMTATYLTQEEAYESVKHNLQMKDEIKRHHLRLYIIDFYYFIYYMSIIIKKQT